MKSPGSMCSAYDDSPTSLGLQHWQHATCDSKRVARCATGNPGGTLRKLCPLEKMSLPDKASGNCAVSAPLGHVLHNKPNRSMARSSQTYYEREQLAVSPGEAS